MTQDVRVICLVATFFLSKVSTTPLLSPLGGRPPPADEVTLPESVQEGASQVRFSAGKGKEKVPRR